MRRAITLVLMSIVLVPMSMAQSPYVNDVLALNPVGYWRLDGNANDSSVNSNNGVLQNSVNFTGPGGGPPIGDPGNQAAIFNISQDQYITMPMTATGSVFALDGNHPFSMMIWAKTNY